MATTTIARTAMTDDDGTGTTGTVINNAWKVELYNQIDAILSAALTLGSTIDAKGYGGHAGTAGAVANAFNVYWTGAVAQLWIDTSNVGNLTLTSDARVKKEIREIPIGLAEVLKLRPVRFEWAGDDPHTDRGQQFGLIAQEVSDVVPDLAAQTALTSELAPDGTWRVDYVQLIPVLLKAIQELAADVAALRAAKT